MKEGGGAGSEGARGGSELGIGWDAGGMGVWRWVRGGGGDVSGGKNQNLGFAKVDLKQ